MSNIVDILRARAREWVPRDTAASARGIQLAAEYNEAADAIERLTKDRDQVKRLAESAVEVNNKYAAAHEQLQAELMRRADLILDYQDRLLAAEATALGLQAQLKRATDPLMAVDVQQVHEDEIGFHRVGSDGERQDVQSVGAVTGPPDDYTDQLAQAAYGLFGGDVQTPQVGDIIEWRGDGESEPHRWRVRGVYFGAIGVESLVELANVSHQPGSTEILGQRYAMLVPECLLRNCRVVPLPGQAEGNVISYIGNGRNPE